MKPPPVKRRVWVRDFYLSRHEVTVGQFRKFVEETGHVTRAEQENWCRTIDRAGWFWEVHEGTSWRRTELPQRDDHPVVCVTYADASTFAAWAGGRLPTEAEWEYAAGNGSLHTRYSWGNEPPTKMGKRGGNLADRAARKERGWPYAGVGDLAEYDDGFWSTAPVGMYAPNHFGLHDMTGNVLEWCADWFGDYEPSEAVVENPVGPPLSPSIQPRRVIRGGAWNQISENSVVWGRGSYFPNNRSDFLGFRVARDSPGAAPAGSEEPQP